MLVRRDEWQGGAPALVSVPLPRFPGGEYGGAHLLGALDRLATG